MELLELWRRAAEAPNGIAIASSRPNRLAQLLYRARREVGGFSHLRVIELANEVWIQP